MNSGHYLPKVSKRKINASFGKSINALFFKTFHGTLPILPYTTL